MTDQEQNIAIAEACGWKRVEIPEKIYLLWKFISPSGREQVAIHWLDVIPDYVHDLNAMADARKTLNDDQRVEFIDWLRSDSNSYASLWDLADASAQKQAEAFLRTIGKWKE